MNLKIRLFGRNFLVKEFVGEKEKELPKDMDVKDYYQRKQQCSNCNHSVRVYIKKGVYVKDIFTEIVCDRCGCKLTKESKK